MNSYRTDVVWIYANHDYSVISYPLFMMMMGWGFRLAEKQPLRLRAIC